MRRNFVPLLRPRARRVFADLGPAALGALALFAWASPADAVFEDLAVSPRARAMGQATTAVADDAWVFYYNPAGLAWLPQTSLASATVRPNGNAFNRLTTFGGAMRLPAKWGGVAVGYRDFGVDYQGSGAFEEDLLSERTWSASHGFRLFRDASTSAAVGWSVNFYGLDFGESIGGVDPGNDWAVGLDVGALVTVYDRTRVGFLTRNLNSPVIGEDDEELRQQVVAGIAYEPYPDVITALDVRGEMGQEFRFHGGMEMGITDFLDVRAGLETDPNKLTGGFGVHLPGFGAHLPGLTLDYAFSTGGGVLDSSHQFGIGLRLGTPKTVEELP